MKKLTMLRLFLLFFILTSLNKFSACHGLLNNNMALYNNSSLISGGGSLCCFPFSELQENNITKFFTDIYFACNFQHSWLLQTNYVARVLGFFPYFGIEVFYTSLKLFLLRTLINLIGNKKLVTSLKQGFPGTLNVIFNFEPEYDFSFKRRCCQQIGIGISFLQIDRCIHSEININARDNALSLGGYPFIDLCLIHKLKMKFKYNTNTEIHISFGYVYNPLLLYMFINMPNPKNIKINEPGLFNFFLQINIASISDKGDETIDWFNNDKEIYKRIKRRLRHSFSFPPFFIGSYYYSKSSSDFIKKLFTGFYYFFSSPYLVSFSKVHYLGLYCDINLCAPEFKMNTNSTFGISFTSNYKSVIFEHNIGIYIFADGGIFNKREISSDTIVEEAIPRKQRSNRIVYRPRLYLNIHRFFVDLKKYKNLWSVLKRVRLFVGINIMLYTIANTKDILTNKNSGKQYYDYIPAQVESYIFGFAIE